MLCARVPAVWLVYLLLFPALAGAQPAFGPRNDFAVGSTPRELALADLDQDGHLDLVVACEGESFLGIFRGHGDGTFEPRVELPTDSGPRAMAVVDWNGDGRLDLLLYASGALRLSSYLGQGDGTFVAGAWAELAAPLTRIVPADLDGDGILDLAASTDFGVTRLVTVRGAGGGAFGTRSELDSLGGSQAFDVAVGQFDGGGPPDLFLPLTCNCPSHLLPGTGGGIFGSPVGVTGTLRTHQIAAVDLGADGVMDLVVTDAGAGGVQSNGGIRVLHARAGGGFDAGPFFGTGRGARAIAAAPWGGATESDVVVANSLFSSVSIARILCDGTVAGMLSTAVGSVPIDVAVGDVNEDGTADIVTANQGAGTVTILRMQPNPSPFPCNPLVSVTPVQVAFGSAPQGVAMDRNVVVRNVGTTAFDVTSVNRSGSTEFQLLAAAVPKHLVPGDSLVLIVRYQRLNTGNAGAMLVIATTAPLYPSVSVELSGTATPASPFVQVVTGDLDFGTGFVGFPSTRSEQISNIGTATLTITGASISDSEFELVGPAPPLDVPAGNSITFTLRYLRVHRGEAAGTFQCSTNDPEHAIVSIALKGDALPATPKVQLDAGTLDFGSAFIGQVEDKTLGIKNVGVAPLEVSALTLTGSGEFSIVGGAGPISIAPGASVTRSVRYARTVSGGASGTFHVASNDSLTPDAQVVLTGSAVPAPAIVAVAPVRPVLAAGTSTVVPIVVRNVGPGTLTFTPDALATDLVENSPYDGAPVAPPVIRIDPGGGAWDFQADGSIGTGATGEYGGAMKLVGFAPQAAVATGLGGQELRFGPATLPGGLVATRKVYVPHDGNFVRYANVLVNSGAAAVSATLDMPDALAYFPLGGAASSSGNGSFTVLDDWVAFPPDQVPGRRAPARVSASQSAPHRPTVSSYVQTFTGVEVRLKYAITVPARGRVVVLGWAVQGASFAAAQSEAAALASGAPSAFAGLAAIDRAALWNAPFAPAVFRTPGATIQLASGDSAVVQLVCDASAATLPATIEGTLRIASDDPLNPVLLVALGFDVTAGAVVSVPPTHASDSPLLALAGMVPNPARGAVRVAYTLASDAPATLTIYDARGRILARRAIAHPEPGPGWLTLDRGAAAGMVWLRLEQEGRVATRKGIVLP